MLFIRIKNSFSFVNFDQISLRYIATVDNGKLAIFILWHQYLVMMRPWFIRQKNRRILKICVLLSLFAIARPSSFAQVINNSIENRSVLIPEADFIATSTDESTVEWACVSKALTNRCLIYHNDQWFTFKLATGGKYYLNISNQKCRDELGIQAIIIEGNPCEIKSYKILQCIPKIKQQETFIELDSLKPNLTYLVNIDGFLGDFCNFNIQLSSKPHGLSHDAKNLDTLKVSVLRSGGIVTLNWETPRLVVNEMVAFEIYRSSKGSTRSLFVSSMPVELNALGSAQTVYSLLDTLTAEGSYRYEIRGLFKAGEKRILSQQIVTFYQDIKPAPDQMLNVSLDYKNGTSLQILLLDKKRDQILKQFSFEFNKVQDSNQRIYVGNYIQMGVKNFMVRVINLKTHDETAYEFAVMEGGKLKKM